MNDLIPYVGRHPLDHPVVREDPLAVLAQTMPSATASILNRQLDLQNRALRTQNRQKALETVQSMSRDSAAAACTWLQSRPHETKFDDDIRASVNHGCFFSCETTTVRFSRRIRTG